MQSKTLAMSGKSSLGKAPAEVPASRLDKPALDSFQASTNLNAALFKERQKSKNTRVLADSAKELLKEVRLVKELQRSMPRRTGDEEFEAEIVGLNQYRAPTPNPRTQELVSRITLSRRENHLATLGHFESDLEAYLGSLAEINAVARSEAQEFLKISNSEAEDLAGSLTDEKLLSREKDVLREIEQAVEEQGARRLDKVQAVRAAFAERDAERTQQVRQLTDTLWQKLLDCAFVLEDEARRTAQELADRTQARQAQEREDNDQFVLQLEKSERDRFEELKAALLGKQLRWKQLKHEEAFRQFEEDLKTPEFCNPQPRRSLYARLREQQEAAHTARQALIEELVATPHFTKASVDKWLDQVKSRNEDANAHIDRIVEDLVKEADGAKQRGEQRLAELRARVNYVGLNNEADNEKVLGDRAVPILEQNQQRAKELLTRAMNFVEKYDARENELCEKLGKFILRVGVKNDESKKAMDSAAQAYELNKARLLDEDEERVDKLREELSALKQSLRESLHHPKLEELQASCFAKIDELEGQYRNTHELNKKLVGEHPPQIERLVEKVEAEAAEIFQLYGPERKAELLEKNRKEAEDKALRRIEAEDKKRAEDELRQAEETKKKTGKAPPAPKPKDPKKAAAELEERKQAVLKEIGVGEVREFKSSTNKAWLVYQSIEDLVAAFYKYEEEAKSEGTIPADEPPKALDYVEPALVDS